MEYYQLAVTISLVLQIVVLVLLFSSLALKGKKKFRQHGITMVIAVVLHTITILTVMLPSFVLGIIPYISTNATDTIAIIAAVHGITGIIAAVLGVWIVASWRLRASLQYCAPKKKIMLVTLTLWVIALLLGILLYLNFYTTLLHL
jgi:hypothetical protein